MHQLLPLQLKISLVIALAAVIGWGANAIGLGHLVIGTVIGVVELMVVVGLAVSWTLPVLARIPFLPLWLRTDLSGKWTGEIRSRRDGSGPVPPIATTAEINQSWREFKVKLATPNMVGESTGSLITFKPDEGELRIQYFFETEPTLAESASNPPQLLGAAIATVNLRDSPTKLTIRYTNERGLGGDIDLNKIEPVNAARKAAWNYAVAEVKKTYDSLTARRAKQLK